MSLSGLGGLVVGAIVMSVIYETTVVPKLEARTSAWFSYASEQADVLTTCSDAVTELNEAAVALADIHDESIAASQDFFDSSSPFAGDPVYLFARLYEGDDDVTTRLSALVASDAASGCLEGGPSLVLPD